jgi:ATP-binding cassette, subfamily B, bacterial
LAAVDRVCEVMEQPIENGSMTEYRKAPPLRKGIALESIRFRYEPDQPLFEQVSVDIPAGRVTAIVGPSGAGKSTLFHLLLGFYRPNEGAIKMDGKPLDDWDPGTRASMFAVVTQEAYLFDGTIRDNIALGRPDASEADIRRAAREANAESFILELPGGYDTEVGERGAKLSGGQKQRIAIARAILRDAPVLLLDEATSALDSITESTVKAALERLMAGRTTVMIAHRISTVRQADRILVMDGGQVIEHGTHDALLHKGGMYARLYLEQQDAAAPVRTAR